ncbi:MAG TPA: hypothetical protein DEA52_06620 [Clostridiaceae bacterium]|nr:hypothetical protein [Clostridiaceae bacterium]
MYDVTKESYDYVVTFRNNLEGERPMPKTTYFNLPEEKRERIFQEAVVEFRDETYDQASINRIVQRSGISKGSYYQYFKDKEDLYFYILQRIGEKKMDYMSPKLRKFEELGFFEALRELYRTGIQFALENPDYLEIGNKMMRDQSGTILRIKDQFSGQGEAIFVGLLEKGKAKGEIREALDLGLLSKLLMSMQMTVVEHYFEKHRDKGYSMDILEELDAFFDVLKKGIQEETS